MRALWILLMLAVAMPAVAQDSSSSSSEAAPPASPSDADLERAVRAAYSGAAAFASANGNYFTRDDVFGPLRDAVRTELLSENLGNVAVLEEPAADVAAARACLPAPGPELRIVPTMLGDGITLVAVSDSRDFVYSYDPHKDPGIAVTTAEPCIKTN